MKILPAVAARRSDATWVVTEPGSYIAHRSGHMLGAVVLADGGSFVSLDVDLNGMGRHRTLDAAKQAVECREDALAVPDRHRRAMITATLAATLVVLSTLVAVAWFL